MMKDESSVFVKPMYAEDRHRTLSCVMVSVELLFGSRSMIWFLFYVRLEFGDIKKYPRKYE